VDATQGQIGFSERSGYTAIGTVCNVAARLCAETKDGQILLSQRVNVALRGSVATQQVGALALKGLTQPVVAYNVPLVGIQAAFQVIEGGAPGAGRLPCICICAPKAKGGGRRHDRAIWGCFLARAGATELIEGGPEPKRIVVLEFADKAALKRWCDSPEYQKILPGRLDNSSGRAFIVEGVS
jgi:hypothetical protein